MIYFIILLLLIVAFLTFSLSLSISLSASEREDLSRELGSLKLRVYNGEVELKFLKKTLHYHETCLNPRPNLRNVFSMPKPSPEKADPQGDEGGDVKKLLADTFNEVQNDKATTAPIHIEESDKKNSCLNTFSIYYDDDRNA